MANQEATTHNGAQVGYNRTGRRTDANACSSQRRNESRSEVLPEAHGHSSKQREPPQKPAQKKKSYGAKERKIEREASGIGPTALRPLCVRESFFFLVLLLL